MPSTLDPEIKRSLAARIRYYNELGIYDFYRRDPSPSLTTTELPARVPIQPECLP